MAKFIGRFFGKGKGAHEPDRGLRWLEHAGAVAERLRSPTWESPVLGAPGTWPEPLITSLQVLLCSPGAAFLTWGKEEVLFYNDAFASRLGRLHPVALGKAAASVSGLAGDDPELANWLAADGAAEDVRRIPILDREGSTAGVLAFLPDHVPASMSHERLAAPNPGSAKQFHAVVAKAGHDIRTPLTAILGYAELLVRTLPDPDAVSSVRAIQKNVRQLNKIISGLIDLGRVAAGRVVPRLSSFDPRDPMSELETKWSATAREYGLVLMLHLDEPLPATLESDRSILRQILSELLSNALRVTPRGEVIVSLKTDSGENALVFEVADGGGGLSDTQKARIFEPYCLPPAAGEDPPESSGVELALADQLARLLGLGIEVEGRPGEGTTFRLRVPV